MKKKKTEIKKGTRENGFTLIELTIVMALVTIMSTMSFSVYTNYLKKARTLEVKGLLTGIAKREIAYYAEYQEYTDNPSALGFPTLGVLKNYSVTITLPAGPAPQSFLVTAVGNIDMDADLDEWEIDQTFNLLQTRAD